MDYEFVINCATCGIDFKILWVMDRLRVGPESIAKITCPACGVRCYQKFGDLIPTKGQGLNLPTGRPVRTVEMIYNCPSCGKFGISVALVHTNLSWENLVKEATQTGICTNSICTRKGLRQEIKAGYTRPGALDPSWSQDCEIAGDARSSHGR